MMTVVKRGGRSSVRLEFEVSGLVGDDELLAVDSAIASMLRVLEHGALDKRYVGRFLVDGYWSQIEHAENHLRRRGKPDRQSGIDELYHSMTRLALAGELSRRAGDRAARGAE